MAVITDADVAGACNQALADISLSGTIFGASWATDSVVWPNHAATKARLETLPRIEVGFAGIEPEPLSLGSTVRRRWLYEVNVVVKSGVGEIKPLEVADKVAAAFHMGREVLTGVKVRSRASVGPGFADGPEYNVPVVVRLQAFTSGG